MDSSSKLQNSIDLASKKNDTAILLVSHGSSLPYAEKTFDEICKKFKLLSGLDAEVGYMKVAKPSLSQAINNLKLANPNLNRIIAVPVFLAPGIHTNIDIPIILGLKPKEIDPRQPDGNYPEGHYLVGLEDVDFDGTIDLIEPIGPNPRLLEIINNRIDSAIADSKLDADAKTGILLVSHGSRLGYNKEFISSIFEMFERSTDYPSDFGFMELVEPNILTSINKLVSNNEIDRLVVVPVFIAPGMHTTHDIPTILGLIEDDGHGHSHKHSHEHSHSHSHSHDHGEIEMEFDGEILYPEPICEDDILIDILVDNIKEIL